MRTQPNIAVGVAGWSYDDWNGYVYPPGTKDKLRYLAPYFDVIEINSSFYRTPTEKTVASWIQRTRDIEGFFFTAKLHSDITHRGELNSMSIRQIREGFRPAMEEDRLRHLLAQFRYDFADTPDNRSHLERIHEAFGDLSNLVLELRHNTWQSPSALSFLRDMGITLAHLDYPTTRDSFNLTVTRTGDHAYFRLHGRNKQAWFDRKAGRDETYNYAYSEQEMDAIAKRAGRIVEMSKSLTLIANNHYQGKEALNALELMAKLGDGKVAVPPLLLQKYPQLEKIAK